MTPRESDIQKAQQYILERLEAERSMTYHLERLLRNAAEDIVDILYSKKIHINKLSPNKLPKEVEEEINEIIANLQKSIIDVFETLAIADHDENRDAILPFILGENHGRTFDERLSDYCDKYRDELMLLVGVGLFLGVGKMVLVKSIGDNLKHPYANQLLADGIAAPLTYGRGRSNSMFNAIGDLTRYGIAEAWMKNLYINNRKDGCVGWYVRRGSIYPCPLCDSMVGFHTDESELPLYHSHCRCIAAPVYIK